MRTFVRTWFTLIKIHANYPFFTLCLALSCRALLNGVQIVMVKVKLTRTLCGGIERPKCLYLQYVMGTLYLVCIVLVQVHIYSSIMAITKFILIFVFVFIFIFIFIRTQNINCFSYEQVHALVPTNKFK